MSEVAKPKIPAGVAMMMKSLGIDPDQLLGDVAKLGQIAVNIDQRLGRIEDHLGIKRDGGEKSDTATS